jgi:hypothetical protein
MFVKGTTIVARREQITRMFGKERWVQLMARMALEDPSFEDTIFVTSRISLESFLKFNELLIETFFDGDEKAYSLIGSIAAEWVFTEGPYKKIIESGREGLKKFVETVPSVIWDKYYDFGGLKVEVKDSEIEIKMTGIPVNHPYFELTVSGFMIKTAELAGLSSPTIKSKETTESGNIVFKVEHKGWGTEE